MPPAKKLWHSGHVRCESDLRGDDGSLCKVRVVVHSHALQTWENRSLSLGCMSCDAIPGSYKAGGFIDVRRVGRYFVIENSPRLQLRAGD